MRDGIECCIDNRSLSNKKNNKKIRLDYVDIFRAIGIILMIIGHMKIGRKCDHFIHAFHMPMFFIISGVFFNNTIDARTFIKKKLKTLIIPYFAFGILFYLIWLIRHFNNISLKPLINLFYINTEGLPIAGALWFLTALFFTEVLYYYIDKIKIGTLKNLLIICIAILGNVARIILPFRLPWALDAAFVGIGLFHIGNLIKKNKDQRIIKNILNFKSVYFLILIPVNIVLIFSNEYVNMRCGIYGNIPLFWINAILSTIIGINISKKLEKELNENIKYYITEIGKNSIVYLCLNQFVIKIVNTIEELLTKFTVESINEKIANILAFMVVMFILWESNIIIQKTKLKFLIGK